MAQSPGPRAASAGAERSSALNVWQVRGAARRPASCPQAPAAPHLAGEPGAEAQLMKDVADIELVGVGVQLQPGGGERAAGAPAIKPQPLRRGSGASRARARRSRQEQAPLTSAPMPCSMICRCRSACGQGRAGADALVPAQAAHSWMGWSTRACLPPPQAPQGRPHLNDLIRVHAEEQRLGPHRKVDAATHARHLAASARGGRVLWKGGPTQCRG